MLNKYFKYVAVATLAIGVSGIATAQSMASKTAPTGDLWLQAAKGGHTVEFVSDRPIAGLQFDVEGIKAAEGQFDCGVGLTDSHIASCSITDTGALRVIVFSMDNSPIPDSSIVRIRNSASSGRADDVLSSARSKSQPELEGVLFADADAVDVTPEHLK